MSVTIYTTPTCVFCHMAKEYFKKHGVKYEEKDASKDPDAVQEMLQKSGQLGVPVVDVDGKIVIGFDQPRLAELLKL